MSTNLPSLTCTVVRALYSALEECATLGNEECMLGKLHIIVEHPFPRIPSSVPPGNDSSLSVAHHETTQTLYITT